MADGPEDKWRRTLGDAQFEKDRPELPMPSSSIERAKKKQELLDALLDIANGTTDLARETRAVVIDQARTRRAITIAAVIFAATAFANFVLSNRDVEARAESLRQMDQARREAIETSRKAIETSRNAVEENRQVLDAVKATLRAVAATNATSAKVAKVAATNDSGSEEVVKEVEATAAKAAVAALEVEAAVAPPAEKPKVERRLKAAAKKADSMAAELR